MKLPRTYYNNISYFGTIIAIIAWITLIFFVIQINIFRINNVYFDLYTFVVTPAFLVIGHILIPFGMYRTRKKLKKGLPVSNDKLFVLDLKDSKTRNAILIFSIVSVFFVISTIVGSYKAFHYTESVEFCGKLCHKVMQPEYVAYQNSPHARVKCAECHVGEGADFYVKSKMSGLRQVYKYILGTYPRPIATPIENLRPARETCEKCHWPQKFYTNALRKEKYYLADSANTEWNITLNMKIGANHQALGLTEGIHWHINPNFQIDYKSNPKRNEIYSVKITNKKTGVETIYKNDELEVKPDAISKMESRGMDCMDCHNRPSHEYRSPSKYINTLLASQPQLASIPWLKSAVMDAVKVPYSTTDSAANEIKNKIIKYYKEQYPAIYKKNGKEILSAIEEIKTVYFKNTFPEMKVDYSVYPRHIGHLESNGCFRCHNDKFKSPTGKKISKDCNLCHTIVAQGKSNDMKYTGINSTLEFMHPVDIGDAWKESNCMDCHAEMYK
ncbi:MAG: NapC/NirT family cytochrome c [Bacteroidetes bacterium]|nr:NapC/NirT family cytochrome c [Bacteroidota bacterium]